MCGRCPAAAKCSLTGGQSKCGLTPSLTPADGHGPSLAVSLRVPVWRRPLAGSSLSRAKRLGKVQIIVLWNDLRCRSGGHLRGRLRVILCQRLAGLGISRPSSQAQANLTQLSAHIETCASFSLSFLLLVRLPSFHYARTHARTLARI